MEVLDLRHIAAYATPLGEANGFTFLSREKWIGVVVFDDTKRESIVCRFESLESAKVWLDSYSCF
jgi:hypothetical protein